MRDPSAAAPSPPVSLLVFGGGWLGQAAAREAVRRDGQARVTSRDAQTREALTAEGFTAVDPADPEALAEAVAGSSAVLVTSPPEASGCPGLKALLPAITASRSWPDWIGYVSSTAVYGDRGGGWALEDSELNAATLEGARRVRAERDWLDAGQGMGLTVQLFRLPALYGPGRSPLDRLKDGTARLVRKPGQVFNRIHVDDIAQALLAAMDHPKPGAIYNVADDLPAPPQDVVAYAAALLRVEPPPEVPFEQAALGPMAASFYAESKRVSNRLIKRELGLAWRYPTYREGLRSLLGIESARTIRGA